MTLSFSNYSNLSYYTVFIILNSLSYTSYSNPLYYKLYKLAYNVDSNSPFNLNVSSNNAYFSVNTSYTLVYF